MDQLDQLSHKIGSTVEQSVRSALEIAARLPGSKYVGHYIARSHQNDPARTLFEILLFLFALRYFFASQQSYSKRDHLKLSDAEIDELIEEWQPEPLVKPLTEDEDILLQEIPVLTGEGLVNVSTDQSGAQKLLNLSSPDVYDVAQDPEIKDLAVAKIKNCGVGSCGPAGFYGNEDVHIECEDKIAEFLGTEAALLYSQAVSTAPSVIPCFAKRGDILIVDDAVNLAIQQGILLSRAKVIYYEHNDMESLENQLKMAVALQGHRKRLPRRLIITEGLFETTGNSPDLARIVALKEKYKFRLLLDESWSLGVLGKSGRGLVEEQQVDRSKIDVTIASLAGAIGTYGGFCAGSAAIVEHQRIVSLAYTFSATEPPYLAACTSLMMDRLREGQMDERIAQLKEKATIFSGELVKSKDIDLISRTDSPMIIFRINDGQSATFEDDRDASRLLHSVVMASRERGLLVSRMAQIPQYEKFGPVNAIRVYLPESLKPSEVRRAADTLVHSVRQAVQSHKQRTLD